MNTQASPIITDMKVIPVAGNDSMLLNIGGAHGAFFTRNIVVLTDNAGHTGVGEAPGGEVIYQTLVDAIPQVVGQEVARMNRVVQNVHQGNQAADFDTFGKGAWTFELRVNAVAALEAALLDLLGKALNVPVCELLGPANSAMKSLCWVTCSISAIATKLIYRIWKGNIPVTTGTSYAIRKRWVASRLCGLQKLRMTVMDSKISNSKAVYCLASKNWMPQVH
jgi:L-alanine-DL-glutamate epimerase-like enolase superfamily enzyme